MIKWKGFAYLPIELLHDGWHFYDETWSNTIGPYHSRAEAAAQLLDYCECFLGSADEEV